MPVKRKKKEGYVDNQHDSNAMIKPNEKGYLEYDKKTKKTYQVYRDGSNRKPKDVTKKIKEQEDLTRAAKGKVRPKKKTAMTRGSNVTAVNKRKKK